MFCAQALPGITVKTPGQENVFDCGVFLLQYAENILRNMDSLFDKHVPIQADAVFDKKVFFCFGK